MTMKLESNFYSILAYDENPEGAVVRLRLNGEHEIYRAHFPGQPVTPGVCMIQMLTELVEKRLERKLLLRGAKNIKFLSLLTPENEPMFSFGYKTNLGENGVRQYTVKADISDENQTYAKLSLIYE